MYLFLRARERHMRQGDKIVRERRASHDRSPSSRHFSTAHHCRAAPHDCQHFMISQGKGERACASQAGGRKRRGRKSKQMAKALALTPFVQRFGYSTCRCLHQGVPLKTEYPDPIFVPLSLPPLTLRGCHCQVMKGELLGGEKSSKGHGYIDGKPHCLPERPLAV